MRKNLKLIFVERERNLFRKPDDIVEMMITIYGHCKSIQHNLHGWSHASIRAAGDLYSYWVVSYCHCRCHCHRLHRLHCLHYFHCHYHCQTSQQITTVPPNLYVFCLCLLKTRQNKKNRRKRRNISIKFSTQWCRVF